MEEQEEEKKEEEEEEEEEKEEEEEAAITEFLWRGREGEKDPVWMGRRKEEGGVIIILQPGGSFERGEEGKRGSKVLAFQSALRFLFLPI